jgi:hypothetical protein
MWIGNTLKLGSTPGAGLSHPAGKEFIETQGGEDKDQPFNMNGNPHNS